MHNNLMVNRVLTLDSVMNELRERRSFVSKVTKIPTSDLISDLIEKEIKAEEEQREEENGTK